MCPNNLMKDDLAQEVGALRQRIVKLEESSLQKDHIIQKYSLLANIIESSDDAISSLTMNGTIVSWNKGAERIYGYTAREILGCHASILAPPDRKNELLKIQEKVISGQCVDHFETVRLRKDGMLIRVSLAVSPILNTTREIVGICAIGRNITERKRIEHALQESEAKFRELFEHINSGVAIYKAVDDGDDFVFTDFNTTAEKIEGLSRERIIGKSVCTVFPGIEEFGLLEVFKRVYATGKPERYPIAMYKDQRISSWRENYVYKLPSSEVVAVYEDVTPLKQAEEALGASEEKYRSIFENTIEGIYQSTPEGRFIIINPAMAHMHGFESPEEMKTYIAYTNEQLYVNPEDRKRYCKILEEKGVVNRFEAQVYRKDGTIVWTSANARAVKDSAGNISHFEGTVEDITERKLVEENFKETAEKLRKTLIGIIQAMSLTVEARDPYTAGHQKRVSKLARAIAQEMAQPEDTIDTIRTAGILHDLGKIAIPSELLSKPTKLTEIEFSLIKVHSQSGYDILKDVGLPYPLAEAVLQHHERLDGSGYPQGLKNGQILLEAKILGVADVVEAIASHRPYRPAKGIDVALEEIEKNKDILYDAGVVEVCVKLFKEKGFSFE